MQALETRGPNSAIERYFRASFRFDRASLEDVIAEGAIVEGFINDEYLRWSRDEFIARIAGFPPPSTDDLYDKHITSLFETENTAVARARTLVGDISFEDYIVLVKVDGQWRITHKTFAEQI